MNTKVISRDISKSRKEQLEQLWGLIHDDIPNPQANIKYTLRVTGFSAFVGINYIYVWRVSGIVDMDMLGGKTDLYDDYHVSFVLTQEVIDELIFCML